MIPAVVSISYINYAIVAVLGGIYGTERHDGRGQSCQLSGVCPPGGAAHKPVHAAVELPAGGPGRGGARFRASWTSGRRTDEGVRPRKRRRKSGGKLGDRRKTGQWAWRRSRTARCAPARGRALRGRGLRLRAGPPMLHGVSLYAKPGPEDRLRRLHRRGQDHHHEPHQPLLRRGAAAA